MGRRKRPASAEWEEPSLGSTDALCRAVKRLHTYSPATSSCTTSKAAGGGGAAAEPEVSSASGAASRLGAAASSAEPSQPAEAVPERRPLAVDNRQPAARAAPEKEPKPSSALAQPADAGMAPEPRAAAATPAASTAAKQDAASGLQLNVTRLQQRMEHVAVSGGAAQQLSRCRARPAAGPASLLLVRLAHAQRAAAGAGGDADAVAQPGTPVQREGGSPGGGKGRRLGTRGELESSSQAYALLYEEANNLLKNLHFARLQRSTGGRDA